MKTKTIPFDIRIANEVINGNIKGHIKYNNMVLSGNLRCSLVEDRCFEGYFEDDKGEKVFVVFTEFGNPYGNSNGNIVIELPVEDEQTKVLCNDTIATISNDLVISLIQLNQLKECMKQMMEINQNLINNLNSISENIKKIL